jgi:hypothetical protein
MYFFKTKKQWEQEIMDIINNKSRTVKDVYIIGGPDNLRFIQDHPELEKILFQETTIVVKSDKPLDTKGYNVHVTFAPTFSF